LSGKSLIVEKGQIRGGEESVTPRKERGRLTGDAPVALLYREGIRSKGARGYAGVQKAEGATRALGRETDQAVMERDSIRVAKHT